MMVDVEVMSTFAHLPKVTRQSAWPPLAGRPRHKLTHYRTQFRNIVGNKPPSCPICPICPICPSWPWAKVSNVE